MIKAPKFLKRFLTIRSALAAVLIVALIGIFIIVSDNKVAPEETSDTIRAVEIASVEDLTRMESSFNIVGDVSSKKEATIHTEASGRITGVYKELGDYVSVGSLIAQIENSAQRASVLQATGLRDAAKANLDKVLAGTRSEQLTTLEANASSAKTATINSLLGAYAAVDDAVHHTADTMFSNPNTNAPYLNLTVTDSQIAIDAQTMRANINSLLSRESAMSSSVENTDLITEIDTTIKEVRAVRDFFDTLINALDKSVTSPTISSTQIASFKASASASRSSITAVLGSLSSAKNNLIASEQALAQGVTGAQPEDIAAAKASLTQAEGGLAAAYAALEKTIVRAPISGTINMLSLNTGDFVQAFSPAVSIANNNALEITGYVSASDVSRIIVGSPVLIDSKIQGTVTRVAGAIDPSTNKMEIKIGVEDSTGLTNGTSVIVTFGKNNEDKAPLTELIIPLSALKLGSESTSVFSVGPDGSLIAHTVEMGTLLGDRVVITSGLNAEDIIVTDARGLHEGQVVSTK